MDQQILTALLLPSAYPEPTHQVRLLQTHVSYLFITDRYVYKVKKAVNFGFLDFSHLAQRHYFCTEEVRLNARLCPGMYLGVVEICQSADGIAMAGDGTVIEYAVKMLRLPAERMLNHLLTTQQVTTTEIQSIARVIAEFHRTAISNQEIAAHGLPAVLQENWADNFQQLPAEIPGGFPTVDLEQINRWGLRFLNAHDAWFRKRVVDGWIRDCDGDIHSENICLTEPVRIFDCIEFNPRFRYSDTAADLAFLLMDLDYHRRPDLTRVAVTTYTAITGDEACLALLPFYKVYRALIRAKVETLRSQDQQCSPQERQESTAKATAYLRLARGLTLRLQLPTTLIMMCGLMGCGKTTLAAALAYELGLSVIRSDLIRKELAGIAPLTPIATAYGSGLYAEPMTKQTYATMAQQTRLALQGNAGIIVDASFGDPAQREQFANLAAELGRPWYLLYLSGSDELHMVRLRTRHNQGTDASDGRGELYAQQKQQFSPPAIDAHAIHLDASRSLDTLLHDVYQVILG